MSDIAKFTGQIPEHYDAGLGPHIFVDYAQMLADRVARLNPSNVLEIAAGTGISSRALRDALPAETPLLISDISPPMLDVAQRKFSDVENVSFQQADAMELPFDDGAFDLAVSQFGVMFFPDKIDAYRDIRRVLKSGGHFVISAWGSMAQNPFSELAYAIGAKAFPDDPPKFYTLPFSYPTLGEAETDLTAAGFEIIESKTLPLTKTVRDPALFARGLVLGNALVNELEDRGIDPKGVIKFVEDGLVERFGPAPFEMPLSANMFISRAP